MQHFASFHSPVLVDFIGSLKVHAIFGRTSLAESFLRDSVGSEGSTLMLKLRREMLRKVELVISFSFGLFLLGELSFRVLLDIRTEQIFRSVIFRSLQVEAAYSVVLRVGVPNCWWSTAWVAQSLLAPSSTSSPTSMSSRFVRNYSLLLSLLAFFPLFTASPRCPRASTTAAARIASFAFRSLQMPISLACLAATSGSGSRAFPRNRSSSEHFTRGRQVVRALPTLRGLYLVNLSLSSQLNSGYFFLHFS